MIIAAAPWTEIWQTVLILVVSITVWLVARVLIHRWSRRTQRNLEVTGDLADRAKAQRLETIARTFSTVVFLAIMVTGIVMGVGTMLASHRRLSRGQKPVAVPFQRHPAFLSATSQAFSSSSHGRSNGLRLMAVDPAGEGAEEEL